MHHQTNRQQQSRPNPHTDNGDHQRRNRVPSIDCAPQQRGRRICTHRDTSPDKSNRGADGHKRRVEIDHHPAEEERDAGPMRTYGSSSGSAVAAAANLAAVTVGTETQGSIMLPAEINSVVGIKTTMGLVSRGYVAPLLEWQDVPGPMGQTVTDVAVLLTAVAGMDKIDRVTQEAAALEGADFTQFLAAETAKELRLGIIVYSDEEIKKVLEKAECSRRQSLSNDSQSGVAKLAERGYNRACNTHARA